jgi:hypothetical protein
MIFTAEQRARYEAAAHAMQSGVAADQGSTDHNDNAKHLRVGINSALVETSAIGTLLMSKGIITKEEYAEAIIAGMEAEALRYQELLSKRFGRPVTLG